MKIWTSLQWPVGYYRPLALTLWKAADTLLGVHAPLVLHGLSLIFHILNAALTGVLYSRIRGSDWKPAGCLTALWFLLFPFSAQAIAYPNAIVHPLVAFLVLSAALFSTSTFRLAWPVGLLLTALAPFAAEHGVMAGWFILWVVFFARGPSTASKTWPRWLMAIYGVFPLAFATLWFSLANSRPMIENISLQDVFWSGLYLLQGLLSPLPRVIPADWPEKVLGVAFLEAITIGLLAFSFHRGKRLHIWILGAGWYVLGILPVLISRPFIYVMDGPRLMYLSSVGAAWLWGEFVFVLAQSRPWRWLAVILAGGIALAHIEFLLDLRAQLEIGRQLTQATLNQVRGIPEGKTVVFINYPSWLASSREHYPIGHEGISLVPDYVGLKQFLYANLGGLWEVAELSFPDVLQPWRFRFGTLGAWRGWEAMAEVVQNAERVYIVDYSSRAGPRLVHAGGKMPCSSQIAVFGDGALVLCEAWIEQLGHEIRVITTWMVISRIHEDWTLFLHLYGPNDQLIAQEDGYLIGKALPFKLIQPGGQVQDIRRLPLLDTWPRGLYRIVIGVYRRDTGERVKIHSNLQQIDGGIQLGTVLK